MLLGKVVTVLPLKLYVSNWFYLFIFFNVLAWRLSYQLLTFLMKLSQEQLLRIGMIDQYVSILLCRSR